MSDGSTHLLPVAIVIPVYKGERWLAQTIAAAAQAAHPAPELIVVDDGSPDSSADIARTQLQVLGRTRFVQQENAGVAAARNRGLDELDEDIKACLFLDQDDLLVPGAVDRLFAVLQAHPEYVAVAGRASFIDEVGAPTQPGEAEARLAPNDRWGGTISFSRLAYRNCIWTPGQVLVRTDALRACSGFRADVAPDDDWDLWLRLLRRGGIGVTDQVTTLVRRHADNVSGDNEVMRTMEMALRALAYSEGTPLERRQLDRGYRASERGFARDWLQLATQFRTHRSPLHTAELFARSALYLLWAMLGLRAHTLARAKTGRLTDPRTRRAASSGHA